MESSEPVTSQQEAKSVSEKTEPAKYKPNRRQRRQMNAVQRKMNAKTMLASHARLSDFKKLTSWKDKELLRKNRMTDDQIASVFRVALNRLFKGKEIVRKREKVSFDDQLQAIVLNVKRGFKYKSDVTPAQKEESSEASSSAST